LTSFNNKYNCVFYDYLNMDHCLFILRMKPCYTILRIVLTNIHPKYFSHIGTYRQDHCVVCWRWDLTAHIHNNLIKFEGSLGNFTQKLKKTCHKNLIYFALLVHFRQFYFNLCLQSEIYRVLITSFCGSCHFNKVKWNSSDYFHFSNKHL
jgi:hypothetical protein